MDWYWYFVFLCLEAPHANRDNVYVYVHKNPIPKFTIYCLGSITKVALIHIKLGSILLNSIFQYSIWQYIIWQYIVYGNRMWIYINMYVCMCAYVRTWKAFQVFSFINGAADQQAYSFLIHQSNCARSVCFSVCTAKAAGRVRFNNETPVKYSAFWSCKTVSTLTD